MTEFRLWMDARVNFVKFQITRKRFPAMKTSEITAFARPHNFECTRTLLVYKYDSIGLIAIFVFQHRVLGESSSIVRRPSWVTINVNK